MGKHTDSIDRKIFKRIQSHGRGWVFIRKLDSRLDEAGRNQLMKDIRSAPAWIADIFRQLSKTREAAQ